jgi:RNA polymerase sigma-70 factor (ECF subfamily)
MSEDACTQLQAWIDRIKAGDQTAHAELLNHACERLRRLTRKMLQDFSGVRRWEETDDVCQNALLRLHRALQAVPLESVEQFFRLAATQIRRELLDLARHYFGPEGPGAKHASAVRDADADGTPQPAYEKASTTHDPNRLAAWSEFHKQIDSLPDKEREIFDLLWYEGLSRAEIANVLGIAEATVKKRWLSARLLLEEAMSSHDLRW